TARWAGGTSRSPTSAASSSRTRRSVTVAIDGASEETYAVYRRGGSLTRVLGNIERLNEEKRRYGARVPELGWQFIVFGHNEHELPRARQMAGSLGMRFSLKLHADHWDAGYSPVRDPVTVKAQSGLSAVTRDEYRQVHGREYFVPCGQLWASPQVNWDGKLLGCCDNVWGDFGNVFERGLGP